MPSTTIQTPTPDLAASIDFYERLGFTRVPSTPDRPHFTDGAVTIAIDPSRTARTAIVLHGADLDPSALADVTGTIIEHEGRHLAADPSGVLLWLDPEPAPAHHADSSILGPFAGLSIEAVDPVRTVAFWTAAGWHTDGDPSSGYVSLSRPGCTVLSVMGMHTCPHLFPNPGLTYFNSGRNPEVIAQLRARNIPIAEEITHFSETGEVDNVILRDPGGTGFFVFND